MISSIIIEDEAPAARKLQRLLESYEDIKLEAILKSVSEAKYWLNAHPTPQLVFSDIVLGDGLSFDIFENTTAKPFIIYTTAFDQYTLSAFKLNSIDYLLKPINKIELDNAIKKFKTFLPSDESIDINLIKSILTQQIPKLERLVVKVGNQLKVINVTQISCFYTENKTVFLFTNTGIALPVENNLEELEDMLDDKFFFRVNRQFIININFIESVKMMPYYVIKLTSQPQKEILLSRERVKPF